MSRMKYLLIALGLLVASVIALTVSAQEGSNYEDILDEVSRSSSTLLDSNLYTQIDNKTTYIQPTVDMSTYKKKLENEQVALYVDEETFAIRIMNKDTGYIWSSSPLYDLDSFNGTWKRKLQSPFSYVYVNDKNNDVSKSMLDSQRKLELEIEVDKSTNTVHFYVDMEDTEFKIHYTITLNGNEFTVNLPQDGIEEYGDNRLLNISFFEFFGAAKLDEIPGYNFIPSGNGALVRYVAHPKISTAFRVRYYAQDLFYKLNDQELTLNYPVFGAVHGIDQNAYFVNITSGAEFAEYNYLPPKFRTDYHMQYLNFLVREKYQQAIKGSDSRTIIESNLKSYDISFTISILSNENANYVGMAHTYKDYLKETEVLDKSEAENSLQLHLDVLGSDYEKGLFFKSNFKMTTVAQILSINEELQENGVENIYYTLRGFNKGGNVEASFDNYEFNKKLGDIDDLNDLDVDYYYNPTLIHQEDNKAPREALETIDRRFAYERLNGGEHYRYYADIDKVVNQFPSAYKDLQNYGGMALDGLSNLFYSNKNHDRNEMYSIYDSLLSEKIAMFNPNAIMLKNTSRFLNSPFQHERLRFFTDNVPFLQIVLSGYVPYYSTYLNFSANMQMDILKVIDFGANPAYLITHEPSHLLSNTFSREYYASYYGNLDEYIVDSYEYINNALQHVLGEEIVNREVVAFGVVVVTYSNDVQIIINYSDVPYNYEGLEVAAQDYMVRK